MTIDQTISQAAKVEVEHAVERAMSQYLAPAQKYLNTKKAAQYIGMSTQFLEIARHKGDGPEYLKMSKAVRYKRSDLDAWMERFRRRHTSEGAT
jgi:predicted DNA-binding transcriptional regulator AlpA